MERPAETERGGKGFGIELRDLKGLHTEVENYSSDSVS